MLNNVLGTNIFIMHKKIYHHNSCQTLETNGSTLRRDNGQLLDEVKRELSRPRFDLCYQLKPRAEEDNHFCIRSDIKIPLFVYLYKAISDHKHNPFRQTGTIFADLA